MKPRDTGVEPIIWLLSGLLIFFSGILILCDVKLANDGQVFQVFAGIVSNITGALFMRVKPAKSTPGQTAAKTITTDGGIESVVTSTTT